MHRWEKPLKKEKPWAHGHKGSRRTVGKALKPKVSPVLQNRRNIRGFSGSKRICQENERFHTLDDKCPTDERENRSYCGLTFEQVNHAIRMIIVGSGGPRSNDGDCAQWKPDSEGENKLQRIRFEVRFDHWLGRWIISQGNRNTEPFEEELALSTWRDKWPPPCETLHSGDDAEAGNSKWTEVGEPKGWKRRQKIKGRTGFKPWTDGEDRRQKT